MVMHGAMWSCHGVGLIRQKLARDRVRVTTSLGSSRWDCRKSKIRQWSDLSFSPSSLQLHPFLADQKVKKRSEATFQVASLFA